MARTKQEVNQQESGVLSGNIGVFAELMEEVAMLPMEKQEKLSFFIQGYVASSQAGRPQQAEVAV